MSYIRKINNEIDNSLMNLRNFSNVFTIKELRKLLHKDKNNKSYNQFLFRRLKELEIEKIIKRKGKNLFYFNY